MSSVLEQNSLDEFVQLAQLSQRNFEAERGGAVVVQGVQVIQGNNEANKNSAAMIDQFLVNSGQDNTPTLVSSTGAASDFKPLTIPRRPAWHKSMTAHEIETQENMAFLTWRRDIASIEQNNVNLAITPFEKNVDIWRQLWRVIEKSDLLLQIVDGRNPFFFYSADLE